MSFARSGRSTLNVIHLHEFEEVETSLPLTAYNALRYRYAGQLGVALTAQEGVYRLSARDYVGRVALPGGLLLVVRPKVSAANLFYMLAAGPQSAHYFPPPAPSAESPDVFSFVVAVLLDRVEALLRGGLYRVHMPQEDDLPLVRGRILLGAQLQRHAGLKHRHVCAYADLTADTAENRVISTALAAVPFLLDPKTEAGLVRRARALVPRMQGVRAVSKEEALALIRTTAPHRLNAEYGPVMALCGLLLRRLGVDDAAGPHPFASFLISMPRLFEEFVTSRLRFYLSQPPGVLRVVAQRHDYLDEARQVGIRPDVLVTGRGGGKPLLVLDAKYRLPDGEGADSLNRDLYQVSAYLDRYGLDHGVLVYPRFAGAARSELRLRGTSKRLHLAAVDLSAPTAPLLEKSCAALAATVKALALSS